MGLKDTIEKLIALGFSQQSAEVVTDFLGERVYTNEKKLKSKKQTPKSYDPA